MSKVAPWVSVGRSASRVMMLLNVPHPHGKSSLSIKELREGVDGWL